MEDIGVLYVVATPIGNLKDISYRAIEVLNESEFIACEDTRKTSILLKAYNIEGKKCFSYHKFNERRVLEKILDILKRGKSVSLVSDAGTPCICDPGRILINELRQNYPEIKIMPIPGACTISSFLSVIDKNQDEMFIFLGFFPRNFALQNKLLIKYRDIDVIFYEATSRIEKTLFNIEKIRSKNTKVSIGREITKVFEQFFTDNVSKVLEYLKDNNKVKGEFIVMVHRSYQENIEDIEIKNYILKLKENNFSDKQISVILNTLFDFNKKIVYKKSLEIE